MAGLDPPKSSSRSSGSSIQHFAPASGLGPKSGTKTTSKSMKNRGKLVWQMEREARLNKKEFGSIREKTHKTLLWLPQVVHLHLLVRSGRSERTWTQDPSDPSDPRPSDPRPFRPQTLQTPDSLDPRPFRPQTFQTTDSSDLRPQTLRPFRSQTLQTLDPSDPRPQTLQTTYP